MYNLLKAFLFLFDPEIVHRLTILFLKFIPINKTSIPPELNIKIFGLDFLSPIGLAAGFDKDAEVYDKMLQLGFGFVEVGTVTPKPQSGNPKPRSSGTASPNCKAIPPINSAWPSPGWLPSHRSPNPKIREITCMKPRPCCN